MRLSPEQLRGRSVQKAQQNISFLSYLRSLVMLHRSGCAKRIQWHKYPTFKRNSSDALELYILLARAAYFIWNPSVNWADVRFKISPVTSRNGLSFMDGGIGRQSEIPNNSVVLYFRHDCGDRCARAMVEFPFPSHSALATVKLPFGISYKYLLEYNWNLSRKMFKKKEATRMSNVCGTILIRLLFKYCVV